MTKLLIRPEGALAALTLLGACEGGMMTRPAERSDPVVTEEGAVIPSPDSGDDMGDTTGYGGS